MIIMMITMIIMMITMKIMMMMTMLKMLTIDKDAPWEGFDECLRHLINVRSDGWSGWQTKEKE